MNHDDFKHAINIHQNLKQLKKEIYDKDSTFYTFDFKEAINNPNDPKKISADDFWKLAKIKAKKVSLFVEAIKNCEVLDDAPMGFIRKITMGGDDVTQDSALETIQIKERVVLDDHTKTLLFFQLETNGTVLLFAINEVKEENDAVYFIGHYVFNVPRASTNQVDRKFITEANKILPVRINQLINNMKSLIKRGKLEEVYQQLYR